MCDENYQLPNSVPLTGGIVGGWPTASGAISAWTCATCGFLIYAGQVHQCPTTPRVGFSPLPERKPHKCPVCEGSGKVHRATEGDTGGETCPACDGACVLWG